MYTACSEYNGYMHYVTYMKRTRCLFQDRTCNTIDKHNKYLNIYINVFRLTHKFVIRK